MKIILTGSTGFIGHEVLVQCLQNPNITSIVALSRRELPIEHPKLKTHVLDDFATYPYPDPGLRDFQGARACIWTLGKANVRDNAAARAIHVEYPLAGLKSITDQLDSNNPRTEPKFRFIFCSGAAAERDQAKPLWFAQDYRRIRGEAETQLLSLGRAHESIEVYIVRPGMVLSRELNLRTLLFGLGPSIRVDTLAGVMVRLAVDGAEERVWENGEMVSGFYE